MPAKIRTRNTGPGRGSTLSMGRVRVRRRRATWGSRRPSAGCRAGPAPVAGAGRDRPGRTGRAARRRPGWRGRSRRTGSRWRATSIGWRGRRAAGSSTRGADRHQAGQRADALQHPADARGDQLHEGVDDDLRAGRRRRGDTEEHEPDEHVAGELLRPGERDAENVGPNTWTRTMMTTTASRSPATDSTTAPRRFTGAPAPTEPSDGSRAEVPVVRASRSRPGSPSARGR